MRLNKKLLLLLLSFCLYSAAQAQIEFARLMTKTLVPNENGGSMWQNINSFGFGGFLNFGVNINDSNSVTAEGAFYYFTTPEENNIAMAPCLLGYRHLLASSYYGSGADHGWYIEPAVGYTFGGTDIQKNDATGAALYNAAGNPLNQNVSGPTGAISFGYLFEPSRWIQFNIGLRYEHTFVTGGDPGTNIISLRISHAFSFGRRD